MSDIVIIGAGQAGASLALKLRDLGHTGGLTLLGEESAPPYQRPPLSKAYLLGEMERERLFLRPEAVYAEAGITLRTGVTVTGIDRAAQQVQTSAGALPYDQLALTTGATPRRLPEAMGGDLAGVYTVRSLADVDAMAAEFRDGARLLVVGGGYIGLEAAAVARKQGVAVTLIEAAPRLLQRVACAQTARFFRELHRAHGVEVLEATGLQRLTGTDGHVSGAVLSDGRALAVDFVIAGIGVTPNIALAEAAGLAIENGIACNALGQTSDPAIWAAGDCASFPLGEARLRLESVPNAIDMAENVAANMRGAAQAYVPQPWFWSDQYDVKLQIAGLNTGYDTVVERAGERAGAASFWYYRAGHLIAVDAANDPRAYMVGKRLIDAGKSADPGAVADPATELKTLLRA